MVSKFFDNDNANNISFVDSIMVVDHDPSLS